jgi:hypothetical protein
MRGAGTTYGIYIEGGGAVAVVCRAADAERAAGRGRCRIAHLAETRFGLLHVT